MMISCAELVTLTYCLATRMDGRDSRDCDVDSGLGSGRELECVDGTVESNEARGKYRYE